MNFREIAFATWLLACVFSPDIYSQNNYQRLASFGSAELSGILPASALIEGRDGALYGTTLEGGKGPFDNDYSGTIFRLNKDGTAARVLHIFGHDDPAGGVYPRGGLIEGDDGMLYGTAQSGGARDGGTVFRLNRNGTGFQVLHTFLVEEGDGAQPAGTLVQSRDGLFYGTTLRGGGSNDFGTIFRLDRTGSNYAVFHRFVEPEGGFQPVAGLIEGSDGALYGTTSGGGTNEAGTIFILNRDGSGYQVLHHFEGAISHGASPTTSLLEGSDGALYGTTDKGGEDVPSGIVFKINRDGMGFSVLHSFSDSIGEGNYRPSKVSEGPDGALYGVTVGGGGYDAGLVYKMNKDGSGFTGLHHFPAGSKDGVNPDAALLLGSDGALYGSTVRGGDYDSGTLFKLFLSVPPVTITGIQRLDWGMEITVAGGVAYQSYLIEASNDLSRSTGWEWIGTSSADLDGKFTFVDQNTSNYRSRFYRIKN